MNASEAAKLTKENAIKSSLSCIARVDELIVNAVVKGNWRISVKVNIDYLNGLSASLQDRGFVVSTEYYFPDHEVGVVITWY